MVVANADNKNVYKTKRQYEDRNSKSLEFPVFDVKIMKISTILLLLDAQAEDEVVEKVLYHIEKFASFGISQLQQLHTNRLYEFLSSSSIIKSNNIIVRKFAFKLLTQLVHFIDECGKKLLSDENLIEETKRIFMTSSDDNLVEFACILLHYICDEPKHIDALGRDETFMARIFHQFHSPDPDILLQSLRLLNVIMGNCMLITVVLNIKDFPFKNLEIEMKNDCREIRATALESILLISTIQEHPFERDFASDRFVDAIYEVCVQKENEDEQNLALQIYKNLCRSRKMLVKLSRHLLKFMQIFMDKNGNREIVLNILSEFAIFEDNRRLMIENGIAKEILEMLKSGSASACIAINIMSTNINFLEEILDETIYRILLDVVINEEIDWEIREKYLITFHKLINLQGLNQLQEIASEATREFSKILKIPPPFSASLALIMIFEKLALYAEIKITISSSGELANAVFTSITHSNRSSMHTIRLLNLISAFMDQESFRAAFIEFCACEFLQHYLKSSVFQVRASACNLINMAANYSDLCSEMINEGILKSISDNFECSLCSDGFETMLNSDLSMKFAIRRRLEVSDKISSGFYAAKKNVEFMALRRIMQTNLSSPFNPIFSVNFGESMELETLAGCQSRTIIADKNLQLLKEFIDKHSTFHTAEIHEKIKILAANVHKFLQTDDDCISHNFTMHLLELKFKFASSVIPLGSLIYGNSFEAALLFKALADQFDVAATLVVIDGGRGWNEVCNGNNIVDLIFEPGEIYEKHGIAAQKYLQKMS